MSYPIDTDEFTHNGRRFLARMYRDDDMGAPWNEHDGHGPVSDWTSRDKKPGEWVLNEDSSSRRYYDAQEAQRIALRDGWGPRTPYRTAGQAAAAAVLRDFERLRGWCNDEWHWIGVSVVAEDEEGKFPEDEFEHALWGIESDGAYWGEVARELAFDICTELDDKEAAELKEDTEAAYWASRDVVTVGA